MTARNHIKLMMAVLPLLACALVFTFGSGDAHAALPGDDGVILTTEDTTAEDANTDTSAVVATNPDTGTTTTVATNVENGTIENVTVGPAMGTSLENQTNNVAYGEIVENDVEAVVNVNQVVIDENGVPVSTPSLVATIGTGIGAYDAEVEDMSYSPDNVNVLVTSWLDVEGERGNSNRVDIVNMQTGAVANLIPDDLQSDYYLNAVYGANGNIYFSDWVGDGSDLYVLTPGQTYSQATRIASTPGADEALLDISPDVTKALVYNWYDSDEYAPGFYYYDLATGALTPLLGTDSTSMPVAFSNSGSRLLGVTLDPETEEMQLATFSGGPLVPMNIRALKAAYLAYIGEEYAFPMMEMAPRLKPATATPAVLGASTVKAQGPMLEDTGANSVATTLLATSLLAGSVVLFTRKTRKQN